MNDQHTDDALKIVDGLIALIGDQTDEVKAGAVFKRWLSVQKSFWKYSFSNAMLIAFQAKQKGFEASQVAGFQTWKSLGRWPVKGATAIWILAPNFRKIEDRVTGEKKNIVTGFRSVPVFDVSQTTGEDLPVLDYRNHGDDMGLVTALEGEYFMRGIDLAYISEAEMSATCAGAKGFSRGSEVRILDTLTGAEKAGTLAHELAHSILHFKDGNVLDRDHSRSTLEIEAEAISAVILSAWGIDSSASAFYLAAWQGDSAKIKESMSRIANTVKSVLSNIMHEKCEEE